MPTGAGCGFIMRHTSKLGARVTGQVAYRADCAFRNMSARTFALLLALVVALGASSWSDQLLADDAPRNKVRIALVRDATAQGSGFWANAFREQLAKLGYVENRNLVIVDRLTDGVQSRLPQIMQEVTESDVDLIFCNGTPAATAAKKATNRIPIVVLGMADPVRAGLVASVARPGGNLTGLSMGFDQAFVGKWMELLQETVPRLKTVAVMSNPNNSMHRYLEADVTAGATQRGLKIRIVPVAGTGDLETAFKEARQNAEAAIVFGDAATFGDMRRVTGVAAKYRVPVMYGLGRFVENGGFMAYAPDGLDLVRRAAEMTDMILRGSNPGDLPIEQPRKFELLVNLPAAGALGITVPESVLLRADKIVR
jgi:putative tryptophan/tyrosine transport system substrate-binding protein